MENVYLVRNVISDQLAKQLCTAFAQLTYKPIQNPDRLRGQSQPYEMYTAWNKRQNMCLLHAGLIRSTVRRIVSKFDKSIVGDANTGVGAKAITSKKGCESQKHHPDYQPGVCRKDVSRYWSVIVALEEGTRLEICLGDGSDPLIVSIPIGMALLFRGDVIHGGASYFLKENTRFFFKLVPFHEAWHISNLSTEANERLDTGSNCNHHIPTQCICFFFFFLFVFVCVV